MALQTFGLAAAASTYLNANNNSMHVGVHTCDGDGQLQTVTASIANVSAGASVARAVVYADSAGAPGALLAVSDEVDITSITTQEWVEFPFSGSQKIVFSNSTDYHLGVVRDGSSTFYTYVTAATVKTLYRYFGTTTSTIPDPAGAASTTITREASIYATYDDAILTPGEDAGGGATNGIKVWDGSAWNVKPVKVWNGSAWETKTLKRWDGAAWVDVEYEA